MNPTLAASIEGIGLWAPGLPSWDSFLAWREGGAGEAAPARPAPTLLPANERRRAPDTVLVALQAAQAACTAAGREPATLPSVFASTYGDLGISDHLCQTLVSAPTEVSPIRFHNSVHNAAAGYWTIGTGAMAPATAISAGPATFAMGLLDALVQLQAGAEAVLLVAYDGAAAGPLAAYAHSEGLLGLGLVLGRRHDASPTVLEAAFQDDADSVDTAPAIATGNAMQPALALLDAIAARRDRVGLAGGLRIRLAHG
jgi:hypothetical protein